MTETSLPHWSAAMRDFDCLSVRNGVLHVEGVSTRDLADRFGTPLFVFSEAQLRENLRRFRDAFAVGWPGPVDVLPAMSTSTSDFLRAMWSQLRRPGSRTEALGRIWSELGARARPPSLDWTDPLPRIGKLLWEMTSTSRDKRERSLVDPG